MWLDNHCYMLKGNNEYNIPNYHKQLRELSLQRPYIIFLLIGKF